MAIILVRHAQSEANRGNFAAFSNKESPLTDKGRIQCAELRERLVGQYNITPEEYSGAVAVSEYRRTQATAKTTGFKRLDIWPVLNEPDFSMGTMSGPEIVRKHAAERWAPTEAREQAKELIDLISSDKFPYFLAFTHGMFTATVLLELEDSGHPTGYEFDKERGYVPLQTRIITIDQKGIITNGIGTLDMRVPISYTRFVS